MIVSDLEHIIRQAPDHPRLRQGLAFLRSVAGQSLEDGRIEIDGEAVYALVQSYRTALPAADGPLLEAHRRYIDIQYVARGTEAIGVVAIEQLSVSQPYDDTKDAAFGSVAAGHLTLVRLDAGQLAILWPEDAHAPRLAAAGQEGAFQPAEVKKIVVKVTL